MYRYRFTRLAQRDLDDIFAHIAADNPPAAGRVVDQFLERARRVAETPFIGASRHDLRPDVRMTVEGRYLMFYMIDEPAGEVVFIRVLHSARDLGPLLQGAPPS